MVMARGPPRFHIDVHLVTEAAEGRGFREFKKDKRKDKECDDTNDKRSLDCLAVFLSPSFEAEENLKPKSFD
jgi:hypothetical protein